MEVLNPPTKDELLEKVVSELLKQGFVLSNGRLIAPKNNGKDDIRERHRQAVQHKIQKAKAGLGRYEIRLLNRIANGEDVCTEKIQPELIEVKPDSEDELLFRYVKLHWSIPISSGYGRRLRFLVMDKSNAKLIGIIGLGDPVFGVKARDEWIGWDFETRRNNLRYAMDAFVLGAVPPYSMLLCGKLVALLVSSNEVRASFKKKYSRRTSLITERPNDGRLALITTTSALGRSSIYNRLRFDKKLVFESVGYTSAWGELYFSNGLYAPLFAYAEANLCPTAKQESWGKGFRNRREVVMKCLQALGLSRNALQHRIEREVFVVPLARNTSAFLCGKHTRLYSYDRPTSALSDWFLERWLLPRADKDKGFQSWRAEEWRLWP